MSGEPETPLERKRRLGREASARYRAKHADRIAAKAALMDPEERKAKARERTRRFRERHPNYDKLKSVEFRRANPGYRYPGSLANLQYVNGVKSGPCTDCGQRFPTVCMDFDHLPQFEKVNNVGTMVTHGWSLKKIKAEIAKCELICANCHRIRTHERALIIKESEAVA